MFVEWIANNNPPWESYFQFMSGCLIAIKKQPCVLPVGVGETWRQLFSKCVLKVTRPEATNAFQDEHICARLKVVIYRSVHGDQNIWDANLSTKYWSFLLLTQKIFQQDQPYCNNVGSFPFMDFRILFCF